jgi:hypothetical protein
MEMTAPERFLIDACALIAYFKGEEGCEKMRRFFESALQNFVCGYDSSRYCICKRI